MSLNAVYLVLALIAASTVIGLLWRRRQGAVSTRQTAQTALVVRPADVSGASLAHTNGVPTSSADSPEPFPAEPAFAEPTFGARATLLQFSTEFCASCPATRRMLGAIAESSDGVTHVDVDLTNRADLANRYGILQTPTTFILDGAGTLVARIGGSTRRDVIQRQLDSIAIVSVP